MSLPGRTHFAVIYQWRLKEGMEPQFRAAWEELTRLLKDMRGARGSRLHRTDYGTVVAYAQWPDRSSWEKSCELHALDENLSRQMLDAAEETWAPVFLTPISDFLLPEFDAAPPPHDKTH